MSDFKVGLIQMQANDNVAENLLKAELYIKDAINNNVKLVVLPEFFVYIGNYKSKYFQDRIEAFGIGKIQDTIKNWAKLYNVYIVAGTIPIISPSKKVYNSCMVYDNNGDLLVYYNKIHLFKFLDKDKILYNEADTFESGNDIVNFNIDNISFGLAVCYDLRFPELFRELAGVDAMIIPSAFIHETGKDHWEVLLRARAIENQCYVFGVNQCGIHKNGRISYGNSMAIDPWGIVLNNINNIEDIIYINISKQYIMNIRNKLPSLQHRRL